MSVRAHQVVYGFIGEQARRKLSAVNFTGR
jgi:hypothetical protein